MANAGYQTYSHPMTCLSCEEKYREIERLRAQVKALIEDMVAMVKASAELDKAK